MQIQLCILIMNKFLLMIIDKIYIFFAAKLVYNDQKDRLKDISRECAQKAADMKNFSSLRKDADRGPRKESGRQRGTL